MVFHDLDLRFDLGQGHIESESGPLLFNAWIVNFNKYCI